MTTLSTTDSPAATETDLVPELIEDELLDGETLGGAETAPRAGGAVAAGAAAVAAAGLALVSVTGSWLGDALRERQTLIGNIASINSSGQDIYKPRYVEPWHKLAFVNLGFAVAALVIAGATLFLGKFAAKQEAPVWVRAVAWGALALAVVGLGVSAAIYFDVFTGTITIPTTAN